MLRRILFAIAAVLLSATAADARTAYVTDEFEITLRTGPTNTNKILKMLPTGTRVRVLDETDGWARISAEGKEGFVLTRYLTGDTPKQIIIDSLSKKNKNLTERTEKAVADLQKAKTEIQDLRTRLNSASSELKQVSGAYETLSADASGVADLRQRFEEASENLEAATAEVKDLKLDNQLMAKQTRLQWFLYGAGVVVFSGLVGFIFGRTGKKRKATLY